MIVLDTHIWIWWVHARRVTPDLKNDVLISAATLWEIAIKMSIGKLGLARPFDRLFIAPWHRTPRRESTALYV